MVVDTVSGGLWSWARFTPGVEGGVGVDGMGMDVTGSDSVLSVAGFGWLHLQFATVDVM